MNCAIKLSVAIALLNEELVIPLLLKRVRAVLDVLPGGPHEMVFVDDGSTDLTHELLENAALNDPRIVVVKLSRNFGHQAGLCAALAHVTGDAVVLMDGDLQDSPEAIPRLLEAFHQGYDVVYAVRTKRKEGLLLRACYYVFYRIITRLADVKLPHDAGDFCLMSRRVVNELNATPERHRYLRGLRTWVGFRQMGIPVEREGRSAGQPKYNLWRLFRLACDGVFSFSVAPLRAATALGFATLVLSMLWAAYAIFAKVFLSRSPEGFTALAVSIAFFSGVQLIFLGVIGEYIGRIYEEVKGRPHFIVQQVTRCSKPWNHSTPKPTATSTSDIGGGVLENR